MHGASHSRSTQVFDIQSYVKNQKRQKLEEMMSSSERIPDKIPLSLLHDGDEKNSGECGFDIDDLIKEIDAKIAELEEEEKQSE